MKRLDLIIPHEHLIEINEILHRHKVGGMTFYDVKGRGRTKYEPVEAGRGGMRYIPEFASRTKIEVIVSDSILKPIINDILKALSRASATDGKIFVFDVIEAYDIQTKETGDIAT
jgi:nitrogen regulatory protein P-II 1